MRHYTWIPVIALLICFSCEQAAEEEIVTSQLSVAMADPGRVVSLDLSNQGLEQFPQEILQMKHLESLDLSGNKLTQIPGDLSALKELRVIVLSGNRLEVFPEGLKTLPRVEIIELNRNRIAAVRLDPAKFSRLRTLELEGNPIAVFPGELLQVRSLERIDLGGTLICDPPSADALKPLKSLTHLFLSPATPATKRDELHASGYDTRVVVKYLSMAYQHALAEKITVYDSGILQETQPDSVARSVRYLDLSNSGLTEIPEELRRYTNLEYLDLSGNSLRETGEILRALTKLKSVDLSRNLFTVLDADQLPAALRYFDAGSNRIGKITGDVARFTAIEYLLLGGNELNALEGWKLPVLKYADLSANPLGKFPASLSRTPPSEVLLLPSSLKRSDAKSSGSSVPVILYRDERCGTDVLQNKREK